MMKRIILLCTLIAALVACSDNESFTTSSSARLTFTVDTVKLDTIFSGVGSSTYSFWAHNLGEDGVRLTSVRLQRGNQTGFRVNVDGSYLDNQLGSVVTDLEVRGGDSIRVFVELTAPATGAIEPQRVADNLLFTLESGVTQQVPLLGFTWDAIDLRDLVVSRDTTLSSVKPLVVYGGIKVDSAVVLTIRDATLYFHGKAGIDVYGTLVTENVLLRGDRLDHMFDYLPYDRVSGQWRGLHFFSSSGNNMMGTTEVRNAEDGVVLDSAKVDPQWQRLYMKNCIVHNCKGYGVKALSAYIGMENCQITNTLNDCVAAYGGAVLMQNCTLAQFYPFSANRGMALRFTNLVGKYPYPLETLRCVNSIVTGYADDVVMGEHKDSTVTYNYYFENTLLRTPEVKDSTRFVNVMWELPSDSTKGTRHFVTIDEKNLIYDFHLDSLSVAKGKGCYPEP